MQTSPGRSDRRGVLSGVPQGSILGPLLFSIYTRNITSCVKHCKVHQYADDTQLYYSFPPSDWLGAKRAIEDDIANFGTPF